MNPGSPTSPKAVAERRQSLDQARRVLGGSRLSYVVDRCRDRLVLDVGCADHTVDAPGDVWLHKHIVEVARGCLGADLDEERVAEMRARGYEAIVADITNRSDLAKLVERGPYEIIVAGEVIEHLSSPGDLLQAAATLLPVGGELLVTTPNPYAPWRFRAGLDGRVWENVDHVSYLFPSGMAELASRAGFRLIEYGTVNWSESPDLSLRLLGRWLAAACYHRVFHGIKDESRRSKLPLHSTWVGLFDLLQLASHSRAGLWRETAVYLMEKLG